MRMKELDEIIKIATDVSDEVHKRLTGDEKEYDEIYAWLTDLGDIKGKCNRVRAEMEKAESRIIELEDEVESFNNDDVNY